jgi:hypothetical protein
MIFLDNEFFKGFPLRASWPTRESTNLIRTPFNCHTAKR